MATEAQRAAFSAVLQRALDDARMSQRALARAVGVSANAASQWSRGATAPPRDTAVKIEQALGLEDGTLTRLLGYMPVSTMEGEMLGVLDAIARDPNLGQRERDLLRTMYQELVRQRSERLDGKPGEQPPALAEKERHHSG